MLRGVVIPAAGAGTRLRARTGKRIPKALLPVAGKPLIAWNLEVLRELGVERIWLVTGAHHRPFAVLEKVYGVERIHHSDWERGNGESLRAGLLRAFDVVEEVGVIMSDHLYAPELLEDLVRAEPGNRMWVDPFVREVWDLPDGMKVALNPPALSKTLDRFDGVDIGMFRPTPNILVWFEEARRRKAPGIADALQLALAAGELAVRWLPRGGLWLDVDTPETLEEAGRRMLAGVWQRGRGYDAAAHG